jgi:hypothetical protein
MRRRITLELVGHAQLQFAPFTRDFAQVVALLPALQTVRRRVAFALFLQCGGVLDRQQLQSFLEGVEQSRNVIINCARGSDAPVIISGSRSMALRHVRRIASRRERRCEARAANGSSIGRADSIVHPDRGMNFYTVIDAFVCRARGQRAANAPLALSTALSRIAAEALNRC